MVTVGAGMEVGAGSAVLAGGGADGERGPGPELGVLGAGEEEYVRRSRSVRCWLEFGANSGAKRSPTWFATTIAQLNSRARVRRR